MAQVNPGHWCTWSSTHQLPPYSSRLNTQTPTAPAAQSGSCAYLPGARTAGPSSTRLLCLKLRGACCHLVEILFLIFSYILSVCWALRARPLLQVAAPALEHHRPGGGIAPQRQIPVYRICSLLLFTELKTQNNGIDPVSHHAPCVVFTGC